MFSPLLEKVQLPDPLVEIGKKYSVQIEVVHDTYSWTGRGYAAKAGVPPIADLDKETKLFASHWNRYPVSVINGTKLKRNVFGASTTLDGQIRASVPAFEAKTMFSTPAWAAPSR